MIAFLALLFGGLTVIAVIYSEPLAAFVAGLAFGSMCALWWMERGQ